MTTAEVIARLRELGAEPVEVSPGRWVATCPCCDERGLEIVDVDRLAVEPEGVNDDEP